MKKVSDAEWAVLQILWQETEQSLGTIVEALYPLRRWNRNTVLTYLTRMEQKGLVAIDRTVEPHRYAAAVSQEDSAKEARHSLLQRVYRGSAGELIAAFLKETEISAEERARLRKLLDEMEV